MLPTIDVGASTFDLRASWDGEAEDSQAIAHNPATLVSFGIGSNRDLSIHKRAHLPMLLQYQHPINAMYNTLSFPRSNNAIQIPTNPSKKLCKLHDPYQQNDNFKIQKPETGKPNATPGYDYCKMPIQRRHRGHRLSSCSTRYPSTRILPSRQSSWKHNPEARCAQKRPGRSTMEGRERGEGVDVRA